MRRGLIKNTKVPKDCTLVSIDVSSLYTNIPHLDGLEAATNALLDHPDQDPIRLPVQVLRELMSIVLKNNIFEFNGDHYLQLQGTAMGTKMAPSYANIFMGNLEPKLIAQDPTHIQLWKRYIDDNFIIWTGTNEDLETFLTKINDIHPTIKFTHECSEQELTFIDMTVYKGPNFETTNILDRKTHTKKTNKQLYIHRTSYHPKACKKAIATGETIRYLRTNSRKPTFTKMTSQLTDKLIQRGYKAKDVKATIKKLPFENKEQILNKQPTNPNQKPIIFPTKLNDCHTDLKHILYNNWEIISKDEELKSMLPDKPIIAYYKKNKSLANFLVRAKINTPAKVTDPDLQPTEHRLDPKPTVITDLSKLLPRALPMTKCKNKNCKVCQHLRITKTI